MSKVKKFDYKNHDKWVVYHGPGDMFSLRGIEFLRGILYPVNDEIYEWAKAMRYITTVNGITEKIITFPKKKKPVKQQEEQFWGSKG